MATHPDYRDPASFFNELSSLLYFNKAELPPTLDAVKFITDLIHNEKRNINDKIIQEKIKTSIYEIKYFIKQKKDKEKRYVCETSLSNGTATCYDDDCPNIATNLHVSSCGKLYTYCNKHYIICGECSNIAISKIGNFYVCSFHNDP
jgi:hypothetical protein